MNVDDLEGVLAGLMPTFKALRAEIAELREKAQGVPEEPANSAVTVAVIQGMIDVAVGAAIASLAPPEKGAQGEAGRDGVDGTSVTLADVQPWISEEIGRQLAQVQQRDTVADFVKSMEEGIARELGALTGGA
jgi:hypothetical protein